MENKFLTNNAIEIVGTLKKADVEVKTTKDGVEFIAGTLYVDSTIDNEVNSFELSVYAKKVTKAGTISKLFTNYEDLPKLVNQKVRINGEMREERYFNKTTNQMTSAQRLSARFINGEMADVPEHATFEFGGFVTKAITAKQNKEGKTYAYEIEVGQANYDASMLNNYKFQIRPDSIDIVNAINKLYAQKATVKFGGDLRWIESKSEVTTQSGFGQPRVKTYVNVTRNAFITWGDEPIVGEGMYDPATIVALVNAYSARDVEITGENASVATNNVAAAPISARQTSLI